MKLISKIPKVLSVLVLTLSLVFGSSGGGFAAPTTSVPLVLSPISVGTSISLGEIDLEVTDLWPGSGDFSTTGTQSRITAWNVSVPTNLTCLDGSGQPNILKYGVRRTVLSASPDIADDQNYAVAWYALSSADSAVGTIYEGGGAGGASESDIGTGGGFTQLTTPLSIAQFNSGDPSGGSLIAVGGHYRDGTIEYAITSQIPELSVTLSCEVDDGTGSGGSVNTLGGGAGGSSAKSPKTGIEDAIFFVLGGILVAGIYEGYRLIKKRKLKNAVPTEK